MTDVSTEPVAAPAATPPETPPPTTPAPDPAPAATTTVEHTAGGWPVVPLAVTGANSTIGLVAASALVGGPVGAALAATGAAVVGVAGAARRRSKTRRAAGRTAASTVRKASAARTGRGVPSQGRTTASRATGAPSRPRGGAKASLRKAGSAASRSGAPAGAGRGTTGKLSGRGALGRHAAQVSALRDAARAQLPTRNAARTNTAQARRSVADARRAARAGTTSGTAGGRSATSGGPRKPRSSGLLGRAGKATANKARSMRDAAVRKGRTARDARVAGRLESSRDRIRKAGVRKAARAALRRSALRKQGRRLMAALLAAPLGVLGMLSTPLGKRLGWAWLQQPGRRLFRHLMRSAEERKAARDAAIRERLAAEEKALDDAAAADGPEIGDTVQRPFHLLPAPYSTPLEVVSMSGFKFEEAAAEMENAARTYEPENSMEILSMVENLPHALTSVANTFRILAERSDSEFPLEKDIAGAFDEIYGALMRAVDASADLGELFRAVHDHDIARHEDPRNGPEAEKGWNV
ncbi:hypothetical protein [Streptomyces salyersiae]|uniref:Uncharacterized protein n=1 Tax=Streptomyces salyersiae TaxID=3075530 RepID=A0ABU2RF07_9ACTN|nr:hypothetical protein [Streptomyces sp. DSM 41770]MDT0427456.1 hypothetical protein [Streptomyces sp. DSM 41770]